MTSDLKSAAILIVAGLCVGCGAGAQLEGNGSLKLVVTATGSEGRVAGASYVVTVALSGPASRSTTLLQGAAPIDPWTGTLDNLPVGVYAIVADATETPGGKVFHASGTCPVTKNAVSLCSIALQQLGGTTTFTGVAPLISSFATTDAAPHFGETVTFSMTASTLGLPGPSGITFACNGVPESAATGATIVQGSTEIAKLAGWDHTITYSAEMTTSCRGAETVTFTVSNLNAVSSAVTMTFPWSAQGLTLSATINHWPDIGSVTTPDAQIPVGGQALLTVNASDADGDVLTYLWSSGCGGTFDNAKLATVAFTAPTLSGSCKLSVTVSDGLGGTNTGTLTLQVGVPGALVHSTLLLHASGTEVVGVAGSTPGLGSGGSIKKVPCTGTGCSKAEYYFVPADLFGHVVAVGDVKSISYWTLKATDHVIAPADWYFQIYTMPYPAGTVGSQGKWYGARINTEPYFVETLTETANAWNQWSSDAGDNQLRFYESTTGYFGASTDYHLAAFVSTSSLAGVPYATQQVLYFAISTSTSMEPTFDGQVDKLLITLNDGSTALIDFEP